MRKKAIIVCLVIIAILMIFFAISLQKDKSNLTINDNKLIVEIATTSQQQQKGLCCRDSLPPNSGMLFVYDTPGIYSFWMKDTRISLDMFWIDSEKRIVHIEHSVQPNSFPKSFKSEVHAQYVLETNAGYARSRSINVGDSVSF